MTHDHYRPLDGRVAVVTGAASGIGAAIAQELAGRGATVWVADRDEAGAESVAASLRRLDTAAFAASVDVSDESSVDVLVGEVCAHHVDGPDILVNNAGVRGRHQSVAELDFAEWRRVLSVDLDGVFLCTRAFAPKMTARGDGRIINVASTYGVLGAASQAAYSAAKGGVIAFGRAFAREVAAHGVLVHTVVPGLIATNLLDEVPKDELERSLAAIPIGRPGQPAEVARLVATLSGDELTFSTGCCWDASGGRIMQ